MNEKVFDKWFLRIVLGATLFFGICKYVFIPNAWVEFIERLKLVGVFFILLPRWVELILVIVVWKFIKMVIKGWSINN